MTISSYHSRGIQPLWHAYHEWWGAPMSSKLPQMGAGHLMYVRAWRTVHVGWP